MNQPLSKALVIENRIDTALAAQTGMNRSGVVVENVMQAMEVAKLMAISGKAVRKHLRGEPGTCLALVFQANEWGMSPYAVANKSYEVNDQLAFESQLIQAVILSRAPVEDGIDYDYEGDGQDRVCIASATTLKGKRVVVRSPKLKDVHPKNSPLWKSDPDQQFSYYTGRALCRRHFPHVLLGVYDVDELDPASLAEPTAPANRNSGMIDRLGASGSAPTGGFDAAAVAATVQGAETEETETAVTEAVEGEQDVTAEVEHDPDMVRAGATAFVDGEPRTAPKELSPEDCMAWLSGYDAVERGAQ